MFGFRNEDRPLDEYLLDLAMLGVFAIVIYKIFDMSNKIDEIHELMMLL